MAGTRGPALEHGAAQATNIQNQVLGIKYAHFGMNQCIFHPINVSFTPL